MDNAFAFLTLYAFITIPTSIHFADNIPVDLSVVCHEPLEVGIRDPILRLNCIQVIFEEFLSFGIFQSHITKDRCHYLTILVVVDMARHYCLASHIFYMITHNPIVLKVTIRLHARHYVDSTIRMDDRHFLDKDLSLSLTTNHIVLDELEVVMVLEGHQLSITSMRWQIGPIVLEIKFCISGDNKVVNLSITLSIVSKTPPSPPPTLT